MERLSSSAAADASVRPLASSSVAAAKRSESLSLDDPDGPLLLRDFGLGRSFALARSGACSSRLGLAAIFDVLTKAMGTLEETERPVDGPATDADGLSLT
jgi:hypothetical protein